MKRVLTIWALTTAAAIAQSTVTGSKTMQGSWDASGATATKPAKTGATLPATCGAGEFFFNTAAAAGQNVYLCSPANTWTQLSGGVTTVFGRTGAIAAQTGDYNFSQVSGTAGAGQLPAAGGDLSGTLSAATVKGIQGKTVSAAAPSNGQVLTWNGSQWTPLAVSSAVGGDLSGTIAAATVQGIQGRTVSATAPSSGQVLTWNGSTWIPQTASSTLGGDLSGTTTAATVQAIQGQAVSASLPATGEVLTWNGASWGAQFLPSGGGSGNAPALALVFDGVTVIPGETMSAWSCGATSCTTSWTVPLNVNFVYVQSWGGGSAGTSASGASGGGAGGAGGSGGGYGALACPVAPGSSYTVQVGLGGTATAAGFGGAITQAGSSNFQGCVGATGGSNAQYHFAGPPGVMSFNGVSVQEAYVQNNGSANPLFYGGSTASNSVTTAGPIPIGHDGGGYGAGGWNSALGTTTGAGFSGGYAYGGGGGGGSGGSQSATGGAGGISLWGGRGGNGGSSAAACTAGVTPGGGGGGAYVGASGNTTGCNGARGEVRIYYVR